MSFDEAKRERIKSYLIEKIDKDDKCVISKVADAFGISMTSVKRYVDSLVNAGVLCADGNTGSGYRIVSSESRFEYSFSKGETYEDKLYTADIGPCIEDLPDNVKGIWYYCVTEMLNNCIEHSKGDLISVVVFRNSLYTEISVMDNGIGAIRNICDSLCAAGSAADYEDAYLELVKGRFTSDPCAHSGEGIFFTSRFCDEFTLVSNGCWYHRNIADQQFVRHRLLANATALKGVGTQVMMRVYNNSLKSAAEIFDAYSSVDTGIFRTEIPLKQLCEFGEPVARSHAKRICNRLDSFSEVTIDFAGIDFIGQGFADEMFRVYPCAHPEVHFTVVNAGTEVLKMLGHVGYKV